MNIFHLAFKVKDIASTRKFYVNLLGCKEGRSTENWIDFDFYGHQLTGHISNNIPPLDYCGKVDGVNVPIPHFGCVLSMSQFESLQQIFESNQIEFVVKPQIRYAGQVGEQRTMFVFDFSGNPLEFKAFANEEEVFAK